MADIEKMREIFEEALRVLLESAPGNSNFIALNKEIDSLRTRFNDAAIVTQPPTVVHINVTGSFVTEDDLMKKVKEIFSQQARSSLLANAS
jgi:hypothetical protein